MKLLVARRAGAVVQTMGESGFLELILGGVGYPKRLSRLIGIEGERGVDSDALLRLAALGVAIPEDADRLRDRLRLANAESDRLRAAAAALIGLHGTQAPPSLHGLRTLLFNAGREAARDALALAHAESEAPSSDEAFGAADRFLADAPEPRLPISGADLIARGVATGRPVGGRCAPSRRCGSARASRRSRRRWRACSRRRPRHRHARSPRRRRRLSLVPRHRGFDSFDVSLMRMQASDKRGPFCRALFRLWPST